MASLEFLYYTNPSGRRIELDDYCRLNIKGGGGGDEILGVVTDINPSNNTVTVSGPTGKQQYSLDDYYIYSTVNPVILQQIEPHLSALEQKTTKKKHLVSSISKAPLTTGSMLLGIANARIKGYTELMNLSHTSRVFAEVKDDAKLLSVSDTSIYFALALCSSFKEIPEVWTMKNGGLDEVGEPEYVQTNIIREIIDAVLELTTTDIKFNRHILLAALGQIGMIVDNMPQCYKLAKIIDNTCTQCSRLLYNQPRVTSALPFSPALVQHGAFIQRSDTQSLLAETNVPFICITPNRKVLTCELAPPDPPVIKRLFDALSDNAMSDLAKVIGDLEQCEVRYSIKNGSDGKRQRILSLNYGSYGVHITIHEPNVMGMADYLRKSRDSIDHGEIHIRSSDPTQPTQSLKLRLLLCYDLSSDSFFFQFYKHEIEDHLTDPRFATTGISITSVFNDLLSTRELQIPPTSLPPIAEFIKSGQRLRFNAYALIGTGVIRGILSLPFSSPGEIKTPEDLTDICSSIQSNQGIRPINPVVLDASLISYTKSISKVPPTLRQLIDAFIGETRLITANKVKLRKLLQVVYSVRCTLRIQFMRDARPMGGTRRKRTRRVKKLKSTKILINH